VVRTREILPPDAAEAEKETVALGQRLKDEIAGDLAAAFTQGLRQRYPVKIDQAQIQRMY
jgi:peptidyl-prolyl cis-trans isomerase D